MTDLCCNNFPIKVGANSQWRLAVGRTSSHSTDDGTSLMMKSLR